MLQPNFPQRPSQHRQWPTFQDKLGKLKLSSTGGFVYEFNSVSKKYYRDISNNHVDSRNLQHFC